MADSEIDTTQQATSETPPPQKQKNPKRVAAGKAIAEKTRQAREAQKKKLAEYEAIIANNQPKNVAAPAVSAPAVATLLPLPRLLLPRLLLPLLPLPRRLFLRRNQNIRVADRDRHSRFSDRDILQTRRDQRPFSHEKTSGSAAIACFATSSPAIACFAAS